MPRRVKEIEKESLQVIAAFKRLFATRDGEVVLDYLMKLFYDAPIRDDHLARDVGRRDVIRQIKLILEAKNVPEKVPE